MYVLLYHFAAKPEPRHAQDDRATDGTFQRRHRRNWPCSRPPAGFPAPGSVSPSPRRRRPYLRLLALKSLAKGGRGARFFRPGEAGAEQRFLMGSPTSSPTEIGAASSQPHGAVVE